MSSSSVPFPVELQKSLEHLLAGYPTQDLKQAYQRLSARYRSLSDVSTPSHTLFMNQDIERLAYVASRLPATYSVMRRVLEHLPQDPPLGSLLDLGSGPGTVVWAARDLLSDLSQVTLVEQDTTLIHLAKKLLMSSLDSFEMIWKVQNLTQDGSYENHDLVTLSYVLGELSAADQINVIRRAWAATTHFMVLVEPGTPRGFAAILQARQFLLTQKAFLVAPCPHHNRCPLSDQDWCHFSQRLPRTTIHRTVKEASLPFEDEKYSYLIVSKEPVCRPSSRVVRRPQHHVGHLIIDLCTQDGLKRRILSRKQKDLYKLACSLEWGDAGPSS